VWHTAKNIITYKRNINKRVRGERKEYLGAKKDQSTLYI
jgi:hypothetical protein